MCLYLLKRGSLPDPHAHEEDPDITPNRCSFYISKEVLEPTNKVEQVMMTKGTVVFKRDRFAEAAHENEPRLAVPSCHGMRP